MDLDLIYKIVCEKGMTLKIKPMDGPTVTSFLVTLEKNGRHRSLWVPLSILRSHSYPESVLKLDIERMMESLEKEEGELND